jgi:5-methyltetrahydrofolate--homocysteine methyltransferase
MYGKWQEISILIDAAMNQNVDVLEINDEALTLVMMKVGDKYSIGEIFMPGMLLAAKTTKTATEILKPRLAKRTIDLEVDQKPERFVEAVKEYKPGVAGFSGLLIMKKLSRRR